MNAPVKLVQVTGSTGTREVKVVTIEKPANGQAVTIQLSYDQSIRVDLSKIADERIVIVRIGERAIILFDNGATVAIDPFFDSLRRPLANLEFEFGPGRILTSDQLAQLVPFTDDQSILPADQGDPRDAGANFNNPNIDPIGPVALNLLLGPEELPGVNILADRGGILEDLIPSQIDGVTIGGSLEEEHLVRGIILSPEQLSSGNEDTNNDEDVEGNFNVTTNSFTGNAGNGQSLQGLVFGGEQPITFFLLPVTGQPVLDTSGNPVFSQGAQLFFHVVDGNHLIGYANGGDDGDPSFTGAVNPGSSPYPQGPDRIVFELEVLPNGDWTLTIFDQFDHSFGDDIESLLALNLTSVLLALDATNTELTFTGNAFVVTVIDDVPLATGTPEVASINEDDISTPWSQGTSPYQSGTEDNAGPIDPAIVTGNIAGTVKFGSDEHPQGTDKPMFGFISANAVISYMESQNLYSKQSVELASNNGLALVYSVDTSDPVWLVLTGSEPDEVAGGQDTGNPVFELRVNQFTGDYEFRLFDELIHQLPPSGADELSILRSGADGIDFSGIFETFDYDGDSAPLDAGSFVIKVIDDIPEPVAKLNPLGLVQHDESEGNQVPSLIPFNPDLLDGDTNDAAVKAQFAAFEADASIVKGNDPDVDPVSGAIGYARSFFGVILENLLASQTGADAPASDKTFKLTILSSASGLEVTDGGDIELVLYNNGTPGNPTDDLILGRVNEITSPFNGQIAFAIGVDDEGRISVAQYLSLRHPDAGDGVFDEHDDTVSLEGKIGGILTIIDSDGDSVDSAPVDIGGHILFDDDGPKIKDIDTQGQVVHDETEGLQNAIVTPFPAGDANDNDVASLTVFSGVTTPGNDPDVTPLDITDPIGYAQTTGAIVTVQVDYGADGPQPNHSVAYELEVGNSNSGLQTTEGKAIQLFLEGGIIVGRYDGIDGGSGVSSTDPAAFAIHIDPTTGQLSAIQFVSLKHPNTLSNDEQISMSGNRIRVEVTVTDGDGDTDSASINIGNLIKFEDDGPIIVAQNAVIRVDEDDLSNGNGDVQDGDDLGDPSAVSVNGNLSFDAGSDGLKSLNFASMHGDPVVTAGGSPVTANDQALGYFWHAASSTLYASTTFNNLANAQATAVFTVQITDAATGAYTFTLLKAVDHPLQDDSVNPPAKIAYEDNLDINLEYTVVDGDDDSVSSTVAVNIDDDIPVVASNNTNYITNGDFVDGVWSAPAWWGSVGQPGNVPGWAISGESSFPPNGIQFERQSPGFLGLSSSTGNGLIDMGGSPGNYVLTQNVGGGSAPDLTAGQNYVLEIEVGAPFPTTALMEVYWNGVKIGEIDTTVSSGQLEKFAFIVQATGNPVTDVLQFREIGTGNAAIPGFVLDNQNQPQSLQTEGYHGTYVANVKMFKLNGVVDEDGLNNPPFAVGVGDVQPGDVPGNAVVATGSLGVQWGADDYDVADAGSQDGSGSALTGRSLTFTNANVSVFGTNLLKSNGENVSFALLANNTQLVGYVESAGGAGYQAGLDRLVFNVTLSDDGSGSFTFTLVDNLDHAPGAYENDIAFRFNFTATDSDGDQANGTFMVGVDDDLPVINVDVESEPRISANVELDETVQPNGATNPTYDRYNSPSEAGESGGGTSNGGSDDVASAPQVYNRIPVLETNPSANEAIGTRTTQPGAIANLFTPGSLTPNFGADGPGPNSGVTKDLSFQLSGGAYVATNLFATDNGNPAFNTMLDAADRAIFLHKISDTEVVGVIAGADGVANGGADEFVVFRLTLNSPSDPANASITVDQFMPIDHGGTESPSVFDEVIQMAVTGGTLGVQLDVSVTDGDLDPITDSAIAIIGSRGGSFISFDDDGPVIFSVTQDIGANLITNSSFETGHGLVGNNWEIYPNLGVPGWTMGDDGIPFEVQTGGAGGVGAQSGNALIELDSDTEGNPGNNTVGDINPTSSTNATIQQSVAGTVAGQTYELSFWYAPRPGDGINSSGLRVLFEGTEVFAIPANGNPYTPGVFQKFTLFVTSTGSGSIVGFQGTGSENEYGALLDNVSLRAVTIIDDEDTQLIGVGIDGGPGDDGNGVEVTGKIAFDAGTDGLRSIVIDGIDGLNAIYVDNNGIGTPQAISYNWTPDGSGGGTLTGSTANLPTVFTMVVDSNGNYTFTLFAPLEHPSQQDGNENNGVETSWEDNLLLDFGFTITDGDGDTAKGNIGINVDDDTPTIAGADCVTVQNGICETTGPIDLNAQSGADGWSSAVLSATPPESMTVGGQPVQYFVDPAGNILTAYVGPLSPADGGYDSANTVFTVTVDLSTGDYTFKLYQPIDGELSTPIEVDGGTAFGAGPAQAQILQDGDGNDISVVAGWDVPGGFNAAAWLASGIAPGLIANDVNGSDQGWGVDNNNFNTGEFLRFDFGDVSDYGNQGGYTPPAFNGPDVGQATFEFKNLGNGETISYIVHFTDNTFSSGTFNGTNLNGADQITLPASGSTFIDYIEFYTDGTMGGGGTKVDLVSITPFGNDVDLKLEFDLTLADGDLDEVSTSFKVRIFDDSPAVVLNINEVSLTHDETAALQNAVATPVPAGDANDNDTSEPAVAALFSGVTDPGVDPHVAGTPPIGYAASVSELVTASITPGSGGIASTVFSLVIDGGNGTDSNLDTTEGNNILLFKEGDLIVGRVENGPNEDKAAFAIAIDQNGKVYVAQYLSVKHSNGSDHDDPISPENILASVVVTDNDGDTASDSADISDYVRFEDDGPFVNQVQVLDFDDVLNNGNPFQDGQERGLNTASPNYGGFTWAQVGIFNPDIDGFSNPFLATLTYSVHSETNLAFFGEATGGDAGAEYPGAGGSPIVIQQTNGDNFGFLGAWFSSTNVDGLVITVTAYDDANVQVGLDTITVNRGGPVFFDFTGDTSNPINFGSFANIDRLEFDASNFFGFDDFTYVLNPAYAGDVPVIVVDEDDLAIGNADAANGDDAPLNATGTLGYRAGADGVQDVSFAAMTGAVLDVNGAAVSSGGVALSYFWNDAANTLYGSTDVNDATTAAATAAFSIVVSNTGVYTFTLLAPIDHPAPLPPANAAEYKSENNIDISLTYTVTDGDGDQANGSVRISIDDDIPIAVNDLAQSVAEDGAPIGGNVLANDAKGADGATLTHVDLGSGFQIIAAIGTTPLSTALGTYTFQSNGAWTFDPNSNLNNPSGISAGFTYRITDGDGDISTALQPISITDGRDPSVVNGAAIPLDEEALGNANATGTNPGSTAETNSGSVQFLAGSDNIVSMAFQSVGGITVDVNGVVGPDVVWTLVGPNQIKGAIGGIDAILIDLTPSVPVTAGNAGSAAVTATLLDNFPHPNASGENVITLTGIQVVATDIDGDTVTAPVTVTVTDDTPVVNQVQVLDFDDVLKNGAPIADGDEGALDTLVPAGYGGFSWQQAGVFNPTPSFASLHYATHSENNLAFFGEAGGPPADLAGYPGAAGSPIIITRPDDGNFGFLGAWFSATFVDDLAITVLGFQDGNPIAVASTVITVDRDGPTFVDFTQFAGFGDIDTLTFDTVDGSNAFFGFDDFTYILNPAYSGDIPLIIADEDDIPVIGNNDVVVRDDAALHLTGTLGFRPGADAPASVTFASMDGNQVFNVTGAAVTSGGVNLFYFWDGGTLFASTDVTDATTAADTASFKITITNPSTGAYSFEMVSRIDHPLNEDPSPGTQPAFEDNIDISLTYTVTDSDGDQANGSVRVSIDDDVPLAFADSENIGVANGGTGNVITDLSAGDFGDTDTGADKPGADGGSVSHIVSNNLGGGGLSVTSVGNTVIGGQFGNLSIGADGAYTYTRTATTTGVDTFTYTLTDSDGDQTTATLRVDLASQNTPFVDTGDFLGTVEEEHISSAPVFGLEDTGSAAGDDLDTSGNLNITTNQLTINLESLFDGGDGALTYTFNIADGAPAEFTGGADITSGGQPVIYDVQGNILWGFVDVGGAPNTYDPGNGDRAVFSLDITNPVAAVFTLLGPIDHTQGDNIEGTQVLDLTNKIKVTDIDPDSFDLGTIQIKIIDDTPRLISVGLSTTPVVHDETAGQQTAADPNPSNDTSASNPFSFNSTVTTIGAAFSGVINPGSVIGYATGTIAPSYSYFAGADGASGSSSLELAGGVTTIDSGLDTLNGLNILLHVEGNFIVGRVDADNNGSVSTSDAAAFAFAGGQSIGIVQYLPILHPTGGASYDETKTLNPNTLSVRVTITDADGDQDSRPFDISSLVGFGDDGILANATTAATVLDDEAQPGGIISPDIAPGDVNAPEAAKIASGDLNITIGTDGLKSVAFAASMTATGEAGAVTPQVIYVDPVTKAATLETIAITWTPSGNGGTLTGTSAHYPTGTPVFTLVVNSSGHYDFTLNAPLAHPLKDDIGGGVITAYEDNLNLTFNYTATDGDNDTSTNTLTIAVDDDTPLAIADASTLIEGDAQNFNAVFVLDFSGSISDSELNTMLDAVRSAGQTLFNSTNGDVEISVVLFASDAPPANSYGPFTDSAAFTTLINSINPMEPGGARPLTGSTDFTAAIEQTMAFFVPNNTPNWNDLVFFISDGNPNQQTGTGGNSLSDAVKPLWQNFITTNQINVTTIGIGDGIINARLQDVDLDGQGAPILVANFDDLIASLLSVVVGGDISGNVLTGTDSNLVNGADDSFGADGGRILSITVGGSTYTWDGVNSIDNSSIAGPNDIAGDDLTLITTPGGGKFSFDFETGDWDYVGPAVIDNDGEVETFNYVIRDGDGDESGNTLQITVLPKNDAPVISLNSPMSNFNVADNFGAVNYGNNNGSVNWAANWTESSDSGGSGGAGGGSIRIEGNQLRLGENGGDGATIVREVNLASANTATISFDFGSVNSESGEEIVILFAKDGSTFVEIARFDSDDAAGLKTLPTLTGPFAANAKLRIDVEALSANDEYLSIDNLKIDFTVPTLLTYTENGAAIAIMPNTTVADPDIPANFNLGSLTVSTNAAVAGDQLVFAGGGAVLNAGNAEVGGINIGSVSGYGTSTIQINFNANATDTRVEALMQAIGFSSTSNTPGTQRTFDVTFDDGGNTGAGGPLQDIETVTINIVPVNDAPSNLFTSTIQITEDTATKLTQLQVADPDSGGADITLTLTLPGGSGTLSASNAGGVTVGGTPTALTLTGTVAELNAFLSTVAQSVLYTPVANSTTDVTLTVNVNDLGNSGSGGALSDSDPITLDLVAVNDVPVSTDDSLTINEDSAPVFLALTDFGTYSDIEGTALTTVRITTLPLEGAFQYDTTGGGNWVAVTLNQDIPATHISGNRLRFTPDANENASSYANIRFRVSDGTDFSVADYTLGIRVNAINDTPSNLFTSTIQITEDTATKLTQLQVADPDSGGADITVTLTLPGGSGTLSASNAGGVTVGGTSTALTLTGTVAELNAFLSNNAQSVLYTPVANSTTDVTLTVNVNDLGNTGTDPGLTGTALNEQDTDIVTLRLIAANDGPTATITPLSYNATEQTSLNLKNTGLSIADTADGNTGTMTVNLSANDGVLTVTAGTSGAIVSNSGTSNVTISGTVAQINNLLSTNGTSTVTFIHNSNTPPASVTLTLQVNDNGNVGGGDLIAADTATINITAVNDAPQALGTTINLTEDVTHVFTLANFGFTDGEGHNFLNVLIDSVPLASAGTLRLNNTVVTAPAAISAADIAEGRLTFAPADNYFDDGATVTFPVDQTFNYRVQDDGGTANGGVNTSTTATMTLNMSTTNFTNTENLSSNSNHAYTAALNVANFSIQDTDAAGNTAPNSSGDSLTIQTAGGGATAFEALNFFRSDDNLEISWTEAAVSPTVTLLNQFAGGNDPDIEQLDFENGGSYAGYTLNAGGYRLSADAASPLAGVDDAAFGSRDIIAGASATETLNGGAGDDLLFGNGGDDTLNGGTGQDLLVGGLGNDTFTFDNGDSGGTILTADVIADFDDLLDVINLNSIDANTSAGGNQDFGPITQSGSVIQNSITWFQDVGNNQTVIQIDNNGNTTADMMFVLTGIHNLNDTNVVG